MVVVDGEVDIMLRNFDLAGLPTAIWMCLCRNEAERMRIILIDTSRQIPQGPSICNMLLYMYIKIGPSV